MFDRPGNATNWVLDSHIHETIQPVIERETIQEKIIHTTNHVHETEHLKDEFHSATVAPAISMADFQSGIEAQVGDSVSKAVSKEEKPKSQSTSVTKEVSMSDFKNGKTGATVNSKKREAPAEDMDVEAESKTGKLTAAVAANHLQKCSAPRTMLTPFCSEKEERVFVYSS